jgi:hypothetical protein
MKDYVTLRDMEHTIIRVCTRTKLDIEYDVQHLHKK